MGRIRTIKPEFFLHEELFDTEAESGLPTRLAFSGLFTIADREGRFIWKPRTLKAQILPHDNLDFEKVLLALRDGGFLIHYEVSGRQYGCITSFKRHQKINNRESSSTLPPPEDAEVIHNSDEATQRRCVHVQDAEERKGTRKGKEGNKEQGKEREGEVSDDTCRADAQPSPEPEVVEGEIIHNDHSPPDSKARRDSPELIREVFCFWQETLKHPQAKLDEKRKKHIRAALKTGYTVNDLKTAILGCSLTPFNMGDNERGQKYDGLHVILKDADQIDRFIHNAVHRGEIHDNQQRYAEQHGAAPIFSDRDYDLNDTRWLNDPGRPPPAGE